MGADPDFAHRALQFDAKGWLDVCVEGPVVLRIPSGVDWGGSLLKAEAGKEGEREGSTEAPAAEHQGQRKGSRVFCCTAAHPEAGRRPACSRQRQTHQAQGDARRCAFPSLCRISGNLVSLTVVLIVSPLHRIMTQLCLCEAVLLP